MEEYTLEINQFDYAVIQNALNSLSIKLEKQVLKQVETKKMVQENNKKAEELIKSQANAK